MPYKLRKAPKRDLYWVVTTETGKKHSKDPIPMDKAKAQLRILDSALKGNGRVTQQKLHDLKTEYIEVVKQIQQEHQKMVNYAIAEDIETMDTLDLPISDKYKRLNKLKTKIEEEHKKWLSIEKKEAQDAIPEEEDEEENEPAEAASSGLSAARMLRKGSGKCKPPYHDYSKGKASVFALTCIDPRYTYDAAYFLHNKKELHQDYDLFTLAGASVGATKKEWTKAFFDNLELGIKLHGIKEVWCFDHLDCGMYKATFNLKEDLNPKIHIDCMDKLKKLIKKKHPELKFRSFLIDAKGHVSSV
jgi:hypothetical protein